jgi:hypothetical protein
MSDRVGPMAWGSQTQVFLGEDLMHSRDYSDETSRVIDEEVERILREQEDRALAVLRDHRGGLDAVARALLEKETIDGAEVARLVLGDEPSALLGRNGSTDGPPAASPPSPGSGVNGPNGAPAGAHPTPSANDTTRVTPPA